MPRTKAIVASELLERLGNDPGFQARRAALDAERAARITKDAIAARFLVDDLLAVGAPVSYEKWDISASGEDYTYALPVLRKHLYVDAPDPIPEWVARAMAVPGAISYRRDFIDLFRDVLNKSSGFRGGLALAIAATTTNANLEETVALLRDSSLGEARLPLLRPLRRSRNPLVTVALLELRHDPGLAVELATWTRIKRLSLAPPAVE